MTEIAACYLGGVSEKTARIYRQAVMSWLTWCRDNGLDPLEVKRIHFELWGKWLDEVEGMAANTRRQHMSTVKGMYAIAFADGDIDRNPAANVRLPRRTKGSSGAWLEKGQLRSFLDASARNDHQTACLAHILGLHGWRIGSVLGLRVEDVCVRGCRMVADIDLKGCDSKTSFAMADAVRPFAERCIGGRTRGPMLIGANGKAMAYPEAKRIVADLGREIGIDGLTPHDLRRSFVTLARDAGIPDRDIMASTGHASVQMLDYYDRKRDSAERDAGDQLSAWLAED